MPTTRMPTRRDVKPKMHDKMVAWQYAYGVIVSSTEQTKRPITSGWAAVAAALLTMGSVDIQDPLLAQVVELMTSTPQHTGEEDGNGS